MTRLKVLRSSYLARSLILTLILSLLISCKAKDYLPLESYEPINEDISIALVPAVSTLTQDDFVLLNLEIKNTSAGSIYVHKKLFLSPIQDMPEILSVEFRVTDPQGENLDFQCTGSIRIPEQDKDVDFVRLSPGQSIVTPLGLDCFNFSQPGRYSIYAIYHNYYDLPSGILAWKGSYITNTITIEIVQ